MFTISINAKTPEEFKEAVKGLYALFPDSPTNPQKIREQQTEPATKSTPGNNSDTPKSKTAVVANSAATQAERPTIETMRLAVTEFQQQGEEKRAMLKSLFAQYSAKGVSSLDPAHYTEFLNKLKTS